VVLAAAIAMMVVGAICYSPLLFVKIRMKGAGINMEDAEKMKGKMGLCT